jgi:hypothetical protein
VDGHHLSLTMDNDSDVDIFKTNGALKHLYGQEDQMFRMKGTGNSRIYHLIWANISTGNWWAGCMYRRL